MHLASLKSLSSFLDNELNPVMQVCVNVDRTIRRIKKMSETANQHFCKLTRSRTVKHIVHQCNGINVSKEPATVRRGPTKQTGQIMVNQLCQYLNVSISFSVIVPFEFRPVSHAPNSIALHTRRRKPNPIASP